jgi:hypothetical protein
MKLTKFDQNHIAIRSNPVGMWIMGIVFVGFAVVAVLFLGAKSTLECSRSGQNQGACVLTQQSFVKTTTKNIPLTQMVAAGVHTSQDSEGDETYKVVLQTSGGTIPLTSYSSSGYASHQRIADQINTFLADTSIANVEVKQDSRLLLNILGAVFGGVGLLLILLTSRQTIDLDRGKGLVTLQKSSLITKSSDEIMFGDLAGAEVEQSSSSDGNTYRVALVQRNGQRTPLTSFYSSGYQGKQDLANEINRFLND